MLPKNNLIFENISGNYFEKIFLGNHFLENIFRYLTIVKKVIANDQFEKWFPLLKRGSQFQKIISFYKEFSSRCKRKGCHNWTWFKNMKMQNYCTKKSENWYIESGMFIMQSCARLDIVLYIMKTWTIATSSILILY